MFHPQTGSLNRWKRICLVTGFRQTGHRKALAMRIPINTGMIRKRNGLIWLISPKTSAARAKHATVRKTAMGAKRITSRCERSPERLQAQRLGHEHMDRDVGLTPRSRRYGTPDLLEIRQPRLVERLVATIARVKRVSMRYEVNAGEVWTSARTGVLTILWPAIGVSAGITFRPACRVPPPIRAEAGRRMSRRAPVVTSTQRAPAASRSGAGRGLIRVRGRSCSPQDRR
jgi:hypothetical protein